MPDAAYSAYISAYTTGVISTSSSIVVVFTQPIGGEDFASKNLPDCFHTDPAINGVLRWKDESSIEFVPENPMPAGVLFKAELDLHKLMDVPEEHRQFAFGFRTMNQHLNAQIVSTGNYNDDDLTLMFLSGTAYTADATNIEVLESALKATQSGKNLSISWVHENSLTHHFIVDSIQRKSEPGEVQFAINGQAIGCDENTSFTQRIPSLSEFDVFSSRVVQQPEQYAVIVFSDPLDKMQNLDGLVSLSGNEFRTVIEGNELRIFPSSRLTGNATVEIFPGLKNRAGFKLKESISIDLQFENLKPEIRANNSQRTILPSSNGMNVSFDAVSLKKVTLKVVRVYEDNVHQFLQVNDLDGTNQLERVGRPVLTKEISLEGMAADLGTWNTFYIDLSEIFTAEKGALYHIDLSFSRKQALYPCADEPESTTVEETQWTDDENEDSYWDFADNYYDYYDYDYWYYEDYDYSQRENPCHNSYYHRGRKITFNILSSDIALIAKKEMNGKWSAWASDIVTANPKSGVQLSFRNYQGKELFSGTTDNNGRLNASLEEDIPFMLIASSGNQKAYLKLSSGNTLSVSRFDISGASTSDGMKGFIYGERGVWRPGDTLFIGFMLEPNTNVLPNGHPIQLQILDSRNRVVFKETTPKNDKDHYAWTVPTDDASPTGTWKAVVKVGGATFTEPLRIETIKPNRLKMEVDLGKKEIQATDKNISGSINVAWLHGAPADRLRTQIEMTLKPQKTTFTKYQDFSFDDPTRSFYGETMTIFDGSTNASGHAAFNIQLPNQMQPAGKMKAVISSRAYEKSGEFSIDQMSIDYSPYDHYVGLLPPKGDKERNMLLTDTTHKVIVQSLNPDGTAAGKRKVRYSLYQVSWRWWWEIGENDLSNYAGSESYNTITEGELVTDANGTGSFKFKVDYPSWGRYVMRVEDVESGHAAGRAVYIDWPGWAGRGQRDNPDGATMLSISADKGLYKPGDVASISFPGGDGGQALVTIEDGTGVLSAEWVKTKAGDNRYNINISDSYAPNVFVSIMLVQPHAQTENDAPIRMYGVIPIVVEDPATRLNPKLTLPAEIKPESNYSVQVSEENGQEMTYTLAVVDEGLLGLTRFATPDPHKHFFQREALGVQTYDLYESIIGAYGANIRPLLAVGGDEELSNDSKKKANRFTPVVTFIGPFKLKAGEKAKHDLKMTNYVGAVRVMVVARNKKAFGHAANTVPVRKPLMVLASLPRVLGPGEEVDLPVNIFAMDAKVKDVKLTLSSTGVISTPSDATANVKFNGIGEKMHTFRVKVGEKVGMARLEVTATGAGETSKYSIDIEVRNPNPLVTNFLEASLDPGESHTFTYDQIGMVGTNNTTLEVSSFMQMNMNKHLEYLITYPHGCAEQTTSSAFPQLMLGDAVQLTKEQQDRIAKHVNEAINKLRQFQNAEGGFTYWQGQRQVNDWCTSYIGHFLLEAKEHGYPVNGDVIDLWSKYQTRVAKEWRAPRNSSNQELTDLAQSYRLFTLAKFGKPELGSMNRLRESKTMSNQSIWFLAAAYKLAGKPEACSQLTAGAAVVPTMRSGYWYYGSNMRDQALIIEAMITAGKRKEATKLVIELARKMNASAYYNTQETAFSLIAISSFLKGEKSGSTLYSYSVNGKNSGNLSPAFSTATHDIAVTKQTGNTVSVTNNGKSVLYVRLKRSGQPIENTEPADEMNLHLAVTYQNSEGVKIDPQAIVQGTDFIIRLDVSHTSSNLNGLKDLALTTIFPSGWEILNERMLQSAEMKSAVVDFKDIRDDRVMQYFDLRRGEAKTFYLRMNAAYIGRFFLPAMQVEDMYDATNFSRTEGQWIQVIEPSVL